MDLSLDEIIQKKKQNRGAASGGRGQRRGRGFSGGAGGRRQQQSGPQNGAGRFRSDRPAAPYKRGNMNDRWSHDMYDNRTDSRPGANRRPAGAAQNQGPTKLMISNLDFGVTDTDIKELFGEFGPMRNAAVHYDRSARSLGTAHVLFERRSDAVRAIKLYGGVPLDGRAMKLEIATSQVDRPALSSPPAPTKRPRGPATSPAGFGRGQRGGRGQGRGRGGGGRGGAARQKTKTPTAEELDAELDAYISSAK